MRKLVLLVILYGFIQPCFSATGNELKKYAFAASRIDTPENSFTATDGLHIGYYRGFVEGALTTMALSKVICPPDGITMGQAGDVVSKYMNEHPELLHFPGGVIVYHALKEVWSCK